MKVAVIGGGSTYTPELVDGFLDRFHSFPLSELWLMDIDAERLGVVGGFARRMVAAQGAPFQVHLTADRGRQRSRARPMSSRSCGWGKWKPAAPMNTWGAGTT
jgi:alpha-galactosidase/6-phospho-beta-glucosidase family protein